MAYMGFRLGQRANGVSRLHGAVSREMFASLWPGFDSSEVPITSITNGVHAPTWMAREILGIAEREVGPDAIADGDAVDGDRPGQRRRAVEHAARAAGSARGRDPPADARASSRQRGMAESELGWTSSAFDPDVLTIGFARRVPSYKRLTLMLRDAERLKSLLLDPSVRCRSSSPARATRPTTAASNSSPQMVQFADDPAVRHRIAFLPDYDIAHGAVPVLGRGRLAEQPAAAVGGLRHLRHEGRAERRAQSVDSRRMVGRVVRR